MQAPVEVEFRPGLRVERDPEPGVCRRTDAGAVRVDFERVLDYFPVLRERLGARAPWRSPAASSRWWRSKLVASLNCVPGIT
jgi:hypothetical protein